MEEKFNHTFTDKMEDILKDLINICEDNEVMKEAIKDYFKKNWGVE